MNSLKNVKQQSNVLQKVVVPVKGADGLEGQDGQRICCSLLRETCCFCCFECSLRTAPVPVTPGWQPECSGIGLLPGAAVCTALSPLGRVEPLSVLLPSMVFTVLLSILHQFRSPWPCEGRHSDRHFTFEGSKASGRETFPELHNPNSRAKIFNLGLTF